MQSEIRQTTSIRINTQSWIDKAVLLSWLTIIYNLIEATVSIGLGISDKSISLAGFGGDSLIEVASAVLVLWRFNGETGQTVTLNVNKEKRSTFGIGILFLGLSLVTLVASAWNLINRFHPESTLSGLIISSLSLSFMFYLWSAKKKVAKELDSSTVMKDAACSLACIKLSAVLFVGSLMYLLAPSIWWADSLAAIVLALFIGKEGYETVLATRKKDFDGGCGCG